MRYKISTRFKLKSCSHVNIFFNRTFHICNSLKIRLSRDCTFPISLFCDVALIKKKNPTTNIYQTNIRREKQQKKNYIKFSENMRGSSRVSVNYLNSITAYYEVAKGPYNRYSLSLREDVCR